MDAHAAFNVLNSDVGRNMLFESGNQMGAQYPVGYGVYDSYGSGFMDTMRRGWSGFKSMAKSGAKTALGLLKKHVLPVAKTAGTHLLRNTMQHVAGNLPNIVTAAKEGGAKGLFNSLLGGIPGVLTNTFMDTVGIDDDENVGNDDISDDMQEARTNIEQMQNEMETVTGDGYKRKRRHGWRHALRRQVYALGKQSMYAIRDEVRPIKAKIMALEKLAKKQFAAIDDVLNELRDILTAQIGTKDPATHSLRSMLDTMLSLVIRMHSQQVKLLPQNEREDLDAAGGFLPLLAGLLPSLIPGIASVVKGITQNIPVIGPILSNAATALGGGYGGYTEPPPVHYSVVHDMARRCDMCSAKGNGFDDRGFNPLFVPETIEMTIPDASIAAMYGVSNHMQNAQNVRKRGNNYDNEQKKNDAAAIGRFVNSAWSDLKNTLEPAVKRTRFLKSLL